MQRPTFASRRLRIAILGIALICGLAILYGAARTVATLREEANESTCRSRLGQIAVALQNYHDEYGSYPPLCIRDKQGEPMHSWRVLILRYFDCGDFYELYDFNEPWNSPRNSALAKTAPPYLRELFRCPNDFGEEPTWTNFVAIDSSSNEATGPRLMLSDAESHSSKIMVAEVHQSGIHWMEPRDLTLDQALAGLIRLSPGKTSVNFLTTDGKVGTLSANSIVFRGSEDDLLRRWLLEGGQKRVSRENK